MKQGTRKILSRIGAGLMLGMSLFNFGAIWTRQQGNQVPSRTKNIKQEEKENLDQETEEIASIAERHANALIIAERTQSEEEQTENKKLDQQVGKEETAVYKQMLHYGVITVWTVSLGIIFSSVLLDFPISFGDKILALVPVKSKVAIITLEPQKTFFQENEEIGIDIFIETRKEDIKTVTLAIKFNPEILEFKSFEEIEGFKTADIRRIDENTGIVNVILNKIDTEKGFEKKQKFSSIKFSGKAMTASQEVSILEEDSSVEGNIILDERVQAVNLLGKTRSAKFSIISASGKKIRCGSSEGGFSESNTIRGDWEQVLLETKLPEDALVWQEVKDGVFFVCSVDEQKKLHLLVKREDVLRKIDLFVGNKKIKNFQEDNWQEDGLNLYSFSYDLEKVADSEMSFKDVLLRFDGNLNWPKKGLAELEI